MRRRDPYFFIRALIATVILFSFLPSPIIHAFQTGNSDSPREKALDILQSMTPEEKVGQLFLVSFQGSDVSEGSDIHRLITEYYVGGVILRSNYGNFAFDNDTLVNIFNINRELQQHRWVLSQNRSEDGASQSNNFIPMFIGLSQTEGSIPFGRLLDQTTLLPNQMAVGSTWNTEHAQVVGEVLGREISALGFNFFLGPSLDVLDLSHPFVEPALGTGSFGGDPFWVGEMGKAYIGGIHTGSNNRVAVVAKHFPGHGSSDRLPNEEVATVKKSLEELKTFELYPFFEITSADQPVEEQTDALLTTHIRYQGFQGNIRSTTRPVSFDPQALNLLLGIEPIKNWRESGGVVVSDDLGSPAVRKFYESSNQSFDIPRRVALTAFLAGNDILYISDFSVDDATSFDGAVETLEFFAQKYNEDPAFANRVDESVLRILTLKYKLYDQFLLGQVLPFSREIEEIGKSNAISFSVGWDSATLISPSQVELDERIPDPPNIDDQIVFISDTRIHKPCLECSERTILPKSELMDVVLKRYGPESGGLVKQSNLSSFTLNELEELIENGRSQSDIERKLRSAHWIIFSLQDQDRENRPYEVLSEFLSQRPDLYQQKRVILFSFGAPIYIDSTNISKLTAYYSLYSCIPEFSDVSAYLLFRELIPSGSPAISVPQVGYNLNEILFPDPIQIIDLEIVRPTIVVTSTETTPEPQPLVDNRVGDIINLQTGIIIDHNGNPVPDGTEVDFIISYLPNGEGQRQIELTKNGFAKSAVSVIHSGSMEIRVESKPAINSEIILLDIPSENGNQTTETPATPNPEETQPQTTNSEVTPQPTEIGPLDEIRTINMTDWIIAILVSGLIGWVYFRLSATIGQVRWGVRGGITAFLGGMLAYSYLALDLPGSAQIIGTSVSRGVFLVTIIGTSLGLVGSWLWRVLINSLRSRKKSE